MLILLGPPFEASSDEYSRLAETTGLVAYDLRSRLKPGSWGVVRALADPEAAQSLAERLRANGFRIAVVDPLVGHDPDRRIVPLTGLRIGESAIGLDLGVRSIDVPRGALLALVRGEVRLGHRPASTAPGRTSSSTFQAVTPTPGEVNVFRESIAPMSDFDGYAAADLHFITVPWAARIDARSFDFSMLPRPGASPADNLDALCDHIASLEPWVRVDRSVKASSVSSFTGRPSAARSLSPPSGSVPPRAKTDPHFDAYSRMIAEAERQTRKRASAT